MAETELRYEVASRIQLFHPTKPEDGEIFQSVYILRSSDNMKRTFTSKRRLPTLAELLYLSRLQRNRGDSRGWDF